MEVSKPIETRVRVAEWRVCRLPTVSGVSHVFSTSQQSDGL